MQARDQQMLDKQPVILHDGQPPDDHQPLGSCTTAAAIGNDPISTNKTALCAAAEVDDDLLCAAAVASGTASAATLGKADSAEATDACRPIQSVDRCGGALLCGTEVPQLLRHCNDRCSTEVQQQQQPQQQQPVEHAEQRLDSQPLASQPEQFPPGLAGGSSSSAGSQPASADGGGTKRDAGGGRGSRCFEQQQQQQQPAAALAGGSVGAGGPRPASAKRRRPNSAGLVTLNEIDGAPATEEKIAAAVAAAGLPRLAPGPGLLIKATASRCEERRVRCEDYHPGDPTGQSYKLFRVSTSCCCCWAGDLLVHCPCADVWW
jgi:hypothetical protein